MAVPNRQRFPHSSKILERVWPGRAMKSQRVDTERLSFLCSLIIIAFLLLSLPYLLAAQKTAIHVDGSAADPFQEASGKPVVLVFVRTDCPISNRYAPLIQRISAKYSDKAAFWLVYLGRAATAEKIREHEVEYGYKLAAVRDPQHVLVAEAKVQVTPEAAVFDAHHQLVYHGRIDNWYEDAGHARQAATTHELDDAIQAALNRKTPPPNSPGVGCYIADLE